MRLAFAAVVLSVVVAFATGCGSSSADKVTLADIEQAAFKTEGVGTARVSFEGEVTFNHDQAQRFAFKGSGLADFRTDSATFKAVYKFPNALQEAIKHEFGGPWKANFILDGREGIVLYMRFPYLDGQLPGGKKWLMADIVEVGKRYGLDLDRLKETRRSDPGLMLAYLKSAEGVRKVGTDLVQREVTTHYSTIVDAETIVEETPKAQQRAMRKYLRLMGIKTYPVDLWVDRDGIVRQLSIELEYKLPDGEYVKMKLSEQYYDFGVEVNINPPPRKGVLDITPRRKSRDHSSRRLNS
jgi:hypothetical protein